MQTVFVFYRIFTWAPPSLRSGRAAPDSASLRSFARKARYGLADGAAILRIPGACAPADFMQNVRLIAPAKLRRFMERRKSWAAADQKAPHDLRFAFLLGRKRAPHALLFNRVGESTAFAAVGMHPHISSFQSCFRMNESKNSRGNSRKTDKCSPVSQNA